MRGFTLRLGRHRMRIAWLPALIGTAVFAGMLRAGFWQLDRAQEKRRVMAEEAYRRSKPPVAIDATLISGDAAARLRHRRAVANGRYRPDRQYLLDNRTHLGVAGYHVLTPLHLADSDVYVLVNRGWVPVGADRARLPEVAVTAGPVSEEGLVVDPPRSGLVLGPAGYDGSGWPRVVQSVDLGRIAAQLGAPLLPFVLELSPASEHGYVREWKTRMGLTPQRHLGYAVQWFAMAAALAGLGVFVSLRGATEDAHGA